MSEAQPLKIKVFADGANLEGVMELAQDARISGFTTNPTLMRKAGVDDYEGFARKLLQHIDDKPVSFEVFSDEFEEMGRQARVIASWGANVYVKIPVTNTRDESAADLVRELSAEGLRLNVTALMPLHQVETMAEALQDSVGAVVSIFAGRIADTGRDPIPLMAAARDILAGLPAVELLWASPREVLNIRQAEAVGCDIITCTSDLLAKMALFDRDLDAYSLDTVAMFYGDAAAAGFQL